MFKGGGPQMQQMMKQAMKWQEELKKVQEDLKQRTIEAAAGGGAVKVTVNGANRVVKIDLNPEVIDPEDKETLEELITIGINNALDEMNKISEREMGRLTGGLNLPGLM